MQLTSIIKELMDHNPSDFVAPIPNAEQVEVFTVQDNVPYQLKVVRPMVGWFQLSPDRHDDDAWKWATIGRRADVHERIDYLNQLPRFYVIMLYRLAAQTWLCIPFNRSDAEQRGW